MLSLVFIDLLFTLVAAVIPYANFKIK